MQVMMSWFALPENVIGKKQGFAGTCSSVIPDLSHFNSDDGRSLLLRNDAINH